VGIAPRAATSNPPAPTSLADVNNEDDPAEIDLASLNGAKGLQQQVASMGGGFPGMMGQENSGADGGDMFSQMLAQMQAGGGPGGGQNPFAGMGGMGGGGGVGQPASNPFAGGQQPPVSPFPPQPKTFLDKIFPLIHLVAMVGLAIYAVVWWEPSRRFGLYGANETQGIDWSAWGALASKRPKDAGIAGQIVGMQLAEIVSLCFNLVRIFPNCIDGFFVSLLSSAAPLDVRQRRTRTANVSNLPTQGEQFVAFVASEDLEN